MFEKIGRYQLVSLLGTGGMGEVWSVVDPGLGIAKALKVLRPSLGWDERYRSLFTREAKVAAQLGRHPGFPAIHDYDASGELPYLVMDYIDGVNLRVLGGGRKLTEGLVVHIMRALFRALMIAHSNRRGNLEANVVHGDVKPENIMVSSHGDVFLTDFGISRFVEGRIVTASVIGTIPYMAPENFDGVVCVQSDLFSAGLILHELLCGERVHPKGATVRDVKEKYKQGVPALGVEVDPKLETLRQMLLQVDVDDRLPSASDALDALQRIDVADRHDELSELYLRLIGPPHTGLTQFLQATDGPGSFLPAYCRSKGGADWGAQETASVGRGGSRGSKEEAEHDGPGHTLAVSDEELRAIREGDGAALARAAMGEIEASIPTPSHVVHASTEPVEPDRAQGMLAPSQPARSRYGSWLARVGALLALLGVGAGIGAGIGYVWFGWPDGDAQASHTLSPENKKAEAKPHPRVGAQDAAAVHKPEPEPEPEPVLPLQIPEVGHPSGVPDLVEDASNLEGDDELPSGGKEGGEEARKPKAPAKERLSKVKVKVVFYVGASHPASAVKVGKKKRELAELRGEAIFEESLSPGRVRLSLCKVDGSCTRYGTIRVPALDSSESLFVNLRHEKPRVQRRGGG